MLRELALVDEKNSLLTASRNAELTILGQKANKAAAMGIFTDYRSRKSANTLRRQDAGLNLFADFLCTAGVDIDGAHLSVDPRAWSGVSWGLVAGFLRWQLLKGYAVSSANVRLSTMKTYAKLAFKAGVIDASEYALIRSVEGYSRKEAKRIDEQREAEKIETRIGHKKAEPVSLTAKQARKLKNRPDTPQGRRDALLMCLLLDHGLRVGEVAGLKVNDFDTQAGEFGFYRPKVDKEQTHRLTHDALRAAVAYLTQDAEKSGSLFKGSRKGGELQGGMTDRSISVRVGSLGLQIGVDGLSAHDCRHHWATQAARSDTPVDRLMEAGGWSSPAMPLRYIESARIANEGVNLEG